MIKNFKKRIYHADVYVNLMADIVIQIKSGITINVGVSVKIEKNIACVKKIKFGMLLHSVLKMVNI